MRIAVYSDVHGNTPGLRAVHASIDAAGGIDREICLGDAVYGGPGTRDVVEMLRARGTLFLRGNHDEDLVGFDTVLPTLRPEERQPAAAWHRWLRQQLTGSEVKFLVGAPDEVRVPLPDGSVALFCHAAPGNNRVCIVGPDSTEADRVRWLSGTEEQVLCTGHWHMPVVMSWRRLEVLCPGSVGMSPDGLSRWMLIEADTTTRKCIPCAVPYDTAEFQRLAEQSGMPPAPQPCAGFFSPARPGAGPR